MAEAGERRNELPERARRVVDALPLAPFAGRDGQTASLSERMALFDVPGVSVAVLRDGEIAWAAGFGLREHGRDESVTERTLFQAASISKPICALGVLRLVRDGRLDLDADVNDSLTSWRVPANDGWQPRVTLRQLLSHAAGTTVHGFVGYRRDRPAPTLRQLLDGAPPANSPPVRVSALPGTIFRYSGGGTSIVQQVVEDVTGRPFAEAMRELVFAPLVMDDSTYAQPLPVALHDQAATGHRIDGSPVPGGWHVHPEQAAAGLWTTPRDLLRAAREVQRARTGQGAVLSPELAEAMLTEQPTGAAGLGFFLIGEDGSRRFAHDGDNDGFKALLVAFVEHGAGVAIMTNGDMGSELAEEVLGAVARDEEWPLAPGERMGPFRPRRTAASPDSAALSGLVGDYELRPDVHVGLVVEDGRLLLRAAGQPPTSLDAVGADRYAAAALDLEVLVRRDGEAVVALAVRQGYDEGQARRRTAETGEADDAGD